MIQFDKEQKSIIGAMITAGLLMMFVYFHMISWGQYSTSIIPLKIKMYTGMASAYDYQQIAEACTNTGKYDCAEQAYLSKYQITRDVEVVGELAAFQFQTQNYKAAAQTFVKYYQLEGKNPSYSYFYGQTLEKLGEKKRAERAYHLSIQQNPDKLSLNATSALVHLLMSEGKMHEAHKVLAEFHASADNAKGYLNEEAKILNAKYGELKLPTRTIASIGGAKKSSKAVVKF